MKVRAILFGVGGPINTEVTLERLIDEDIRRALAAGGIEVEEAQDTCAERLAVESFAPDTYQAIVWRLAKQHVDVSRRVYRRVGANADQRQSFELRKGVDALIERLASQGVLLGLAAN